MRVLRASPVIVFRGSLKIVLRGPSGSHGRMLRKSMSELSGIFVGEKRSCYVKICQVHLIKIHVHTQIPQNQHSLKCFESPDFWMHLYQVSPVQISKMSQVSGFWLTTFNMRSTWLELHNSVAYLGLHLLPQHLRVMQRWLFNPRFLEKVRWSRIFLTRGYCLQFFFAVGRLVIQG